MNSGPCVFYHAGESRDQFEFIHIIHKANFSMPKPLQYFKPCVISRFVYKGSDYWSIGQHKIHPDLSRSTGCIAKNTPQTTHSLQVLNCKNSRHSVIMSQQNVTYIINIASNIFSASPK